VGIYYIKLFIGLSVDFQHKVNMYLHYDEINKRWIAVKGGFIIAVGSLDECLDKAIEYIEDKNELEDSLRRLCVA
jgi:hypothetical protein